ncbi:hypothetical protein DPV83_03875 [Aggregatibacter segnis]|uniref:Uncharacterized protein n=1 Tax=Aggregatibacter segnis TaxID=739 RepID=A0A8B2U207_9PAST|nr:hypothetical protein DPV83_03875 [Aggregatibacter segnis]
MSYDCFFHKSALKTFNFFFIRSLVSANWVVDRTNSQKALRFLTALYDAKVRSFFHAFFN